MQTRIVQLFGRHVMTPGTIPFGAPQLSEFPFEMEDGKLVGGQAAEGSTTSAPVSSV